VSQIDELESRLDALTTSVLLPLQASKYVDCAALDQSGIVGYWARLNGGA
jgi:hypothetical protein